MTERVVAAIDQGTTSTRCLLFNPAGRMVAVAQREHRPYYPRSGWVEHDAEEIWRNVTRIVPAALRSAGLGPGEHRRARHREPARDDRDLGPAHRDAAGPGHHLAGHPVGGGGRRAGRGRARGPRDTAVRAPPGDLLRRAAAALAADHVPGARAGAEAGDVLFGTMELWLVWWLTGGPDGGRHITDVTNASRTMLMDLRSPRSWAPPSSTRSRCRRGCCPRSGRTPRSTARAPRSCRVCRWPGRWATSTAALVGQACFAAGEAEVHLRHRRVPADEHRPADRPARPTACSRPSATCSVTRSATRSRARSR